MGLDKIYEFRVKNTENRAFFIFISWARFPHSPILHYAYNSADLSRKVSDNEVMDSAYFVNVNHIII